MAKIIDVIVDPKGNTEIKTSGFTGGACQQAVAGLEANLGTKLSQTNTAEFYQESAAQVELKSEGG